MGPYKFKGVGSPEYYLGGDVKINYSGYSITELCLSSKTYVKQICNKIKMFMGWKLKGYMNPMDPNYHTKDLVQENLLQYKPFFSCRAT
eukprot:2068103-Ditylum_brightwellii.AAC.1